VSGRPGSWHLLGVDSDPLPGDEYDVSSESTHYGDTAQAIRDQVSRLRQIASGSNELVGKYAPALEDSAKDLADHLDDAQGRFDTVAEQLKIWAPVLSDGITRTGSLLHEAESAQSAIDANQAPDTPVDKKDDTAVQADQQRGNRLSGAQGDLNGVQARFNDLMASIHGTADSVGKKITDAAHDGLKDSWWDAHVRKFIHDHAGLIKLIADVLTWIATAIIIAIVIVGTGGLGLALLLTAGALLLHSVLAMNGDGSWVDVGLDLFALVTLGSGKLLSEGARTALALREGGAAFGETSSAARAAFSKASGFAGKTGAWLGESNFVARNLRGAYAGLSEFHEVMNASFKGGSWAARLMMGDKEAAGLYKAVNESIGRNGSGFLLGSARGMLNTMRPVFISGSTVDFTAKVLNPAFPIGDVWVPWGDHHVEVPWGDHKDIKPAITGWSESVEEHTVSHGGYW
jgi:hypothetical protein